MPRQTLVLPQASAELRSSVELYNDRDPGVGDELRDHTRAVVEAIRQQPNRFPKENRNTRRATIIKFHFDVFYREADNGDLVIISFYHQSRKPGGWKYRRWN